MDHRLLNTRRETLTMLLGLALSGCGGGGGDSSNGGTVAVVPGAAPGPAPSPSSSATPAGTASPAGMGSLDAQARATKRRFGSTVAYNPYSLDSGSINNPDYARLLERECGLLVPENEMNWPAISPAAGQLNFAPFDAIMDYAARSGREVRGHNLMWHQPRWMPGWTETNDYGANPSREGERVLTEHIGAVARRYKDRIRSWNVVNEAVNYQTGALYETGLSRAIGGALPTVDLAFHVARSELPGAQLVYNDFMSWDGNAAHRSSVLKLLEGFKTRGVPVDALGIQSHIGIYSDTSLTTQFGWYTPEWRRFLDEVVAMGYQLLITELDVDTQGLPADPDLRDQRAADYTREYLDIMLEYPQLGDVLVWGMSDRYTWLKEWSPRADGAPQRPCPYDSTFAAKPLRDAIAKSLSDASVLAR
jgi:endo-1,4-beta-xylanase